MHIQKQLFRTIFRKKMLRLRQYLIFGTIIFSTIDNAFKVLKFDLKFAFFEIL